MFISKENGEYYDKEFQPVIKQTIPRQLPANVNGKALKEQAA